jgi:hypothetical protein
MSYEIVFVSAGGCRGRDRMLVVFKTTYKPMQSVPITTDVVSSNIYQGEVYNIMCR